VTDLEQIIAQARAVWENADKDDEHKNFDIDSWAKEWAYTEKRALGYLRPIDAMKTHPEAVMRLLASITSGAYQ
jgi:hypothetical protein